MPEWDGDERRHSGELRQVRAELSTVRDALVHVAEGMESFVSTEEIDSRIDYERRQRNKIGGVIAAGVFVAILSILVNVVQLRDLQARSVRNRAANKVAAEFTKSAVNCIVYSLNVHREANEFAHHRLAEGEKISYDEPAELMPPPATPELRASCDTLNQFLKGGRP